MGGTRPGQNYQNNDLTSEELNEIESEYLKKYRVGKGIGV